MTSTKSIVVATILIILTACSYALLSTIATLGFMDGLDFSTVLFGQFFWGCVILGIITLIVWLVWQRKQPKPEKSPVKMSKRLALLIITGVICALVTILYFCSFLILDLDISVAVVLLFQYAWVGLVVECIAKKSLPSLKSVIAAIVVVIGGVIGAGLIGADFSVMILNPLGMVLAFAAAVCYALFFHLSGCVETQMPPLVKSFIVSLVAMVTALIFILIFTPLHDGVAVDLLPVFTDLNALKYIIPLGFFGIALPIFFLSLGAPKLSTGLVSILNAAELPVEVLLAVLVIGETVAPLRWVGVVIVLVGIALPYILNRKSMAAMER